MTTTVVMDYKTTISTQRPTPEQIVEAFCAGEKEEKLLNGRVLTCPACERRTDILDYIPLEYSSKYASQVIPPLKCRNCRHTFALRP